MKTNSIISVLVVFSALLVACVEPIPESGTTTDLIHFGDTINGMTIGRVDNPEIDTRLELEIYCKNVIPDEKPDYEEIGERNCRAIQGDKVFLNCMGRFGDTPKELEEEWSTTNFKITVDDQPLDLFSFGTIDEVAGWDNQVTIRMWNVEIENLTAGQHEIVCEQSDGDEHSKWRWLFAVQEKREALNTLPAEAEAGQHAYTSEVAGLDFLLYIPKAYGQDPAREWPLILFLHGFVEGLQSIDQLRAQFLPAKLEQEADFPFIVISPLRTGGQGDFEYWFRDEHTDPLFHLLEEVISLYSVDPERIYLNGGSAGGNGVWEIGIQYPDRFAALVPVMGYYGYPFEVPDNICDLKEVPIWAFHGALDEIVPLDAEQSLVDAVNNCGGEAIITVIPDLGHDLETEHVYSPELIDWLLSHSRK